MKNEKKIFTDNAGLRWGVDVTNPGASNAIVVFRHPAGETSGLDRYNWYLSRGPEAMNVTGRLKPEQVLKSLTDAQIAELFRRSMPITRPGRAPIMPPNWNG